MILHKENTNRQPNTQIVGGEQKLPLRSNIHYQKNFPLVFTKAHIIPTNILQTNPFYNFTYSQSQSQRNEEQAIIVYKTDPLKVRIHLSRYLDLTLLIYPKQIQNQTKIAEVKIKTNETGNHFNKEAKVDEMKN